MASGSVQAPSALPAEGRGRLYGTREKIVTAVALFFSFSTFLLIQYDRARPNGAAYESYIREKVLALSSEGDQYRLLIPFFARFMEHHAHLSPVQSIPLLQALCYGLALVLLYLQFSWSPQMISASAPRRLAGLGLFLAAIQFPALWIFPYERPETLPTALYVAAVTLLAIHYERFTLPLSALVVTALSMIQATGRGDAPVVCGGGIILYALLAKDLPRPRRVRTAILGFLCCIPGGLTQKYLEHLIPLKPGQTRWTLQLFTNLRLGYAPFHTPILLTALLPVLFTLVLVWRKKLPLDAPSRLALLVCVLDIPAYFIMGLVSEVRIYVPYMLLAGPAIGKIWSSYVLDEGTH